MILIEKNKTVYTVIEKINLELRDKVETMLIDMWGSWDLTIPDNYSDIIQYVFEDMLDNEYYNPLSETIQNSFRNWIQSRE